MIKLKPCPFCRGEAKTRHGFDDDGYCYYCVQCQTCGISTPGFYSYPNEPDGWEKAEKAWNQRTPDIDIPFVVAGWR